MRKYWLFLFILACVPAPAVAVTVQDLYAATVPVPNESASARADALRRALAEVMVRVSGDPRVAQFAEAESVLDQAQSLVQRYGYQHDKVSAAPGKKADTQDQAPESSTNASDSAVNTSRLKLRAVFEGAALEAAMLEAGLPVWGQSRPVTMVWMLANGELVTRAGPENIVKAMKAAAQRRGVPLQFPPAEAATSGLVMPADIRGGNITRVVMVSRRYGTGHVLLGQVGSQSSMWRLIEAGKVLSRWQKRGRKLASVAASAVGHSANVYARRYAAVGTGKGNSNVMVAVQGIDGGHGYTRVREFFTDLTAVHAVTPVLVDGKTVVFRITGPGDADALDHRIGVVGWLEDSKLAHNLATLYAGTTPALGYRISR